MTQPIRLALIYGSTRQGRFCDNIVRWAAERIATDPVYELDVIDPAGRHEGGTPIAETETLRAGRNAADYAEAVA